MNNKVCSNSLCIVLRIVFISREIFVSGLQFKSEEYLQSSMGSHGNLCGSRTSDVCDQRSTPTITSESYLKTVQYCILWTSLFDYVGVNCACSNQKTKTNVFRTFVTLPTKRESEENLSLIKKNSPLTSAFYQFSQFSTI